MKNICLTLAVVLMISEGMQAQTPEEKKELPPGWWLIPRTSTQIKFGGYIKFDLIHDFNPIASPDFFDVSKIPTDGSKGQNTNLIAKETRLFIDTRTPSKMGEIRTYVEGDFYGSGGAFRLRHAFIEVGDKWLAGQWWSNFMDENIIPNTLDFEKPAAYAFARHAMFRYKHNISEHAYFALAIEQPSTNAQAPSQPGKFESPLPDLTGRYRITKDWGHLQVSAFAARLDYRFTSGEKDEVFLWAGNISGQFNFFEKKDKFFYQVVYGEGASRYRGALSAAIDENGELKAMKDLGFTVGYEHRWSPAFTSLLVLNKGSVDNLAGQPSSAIHQASYGAANVLWHFTDRAFAGVEYLWGLLQTNNGENGIANRIQFSVKYSFN
ncbi:MAG: porin [Cyclobacteriaceae bacterium]|nr:porin [Cyclobacteriaceae bacterium]